MLKPHFALVATILVSLPALCQSPPPSLDSVRSLVAQQRFKEAQGAAEALVKADQANPAAHDLYGQALWHNEKADDAIREANQAISLDPKSATYQRDLGDAKMAKFQIQLRGWVKDHSNDLLGMVNRTVPTVVSGGPERGAVLLEEIRPNDRSSAQMDQVQWNQFEGVVKDALKAYNAALALDPANKPATRGKGLASLMLGEWGDTLAAWKAAGVPAFDSFLWEIARNVNDAHAMGGESIDLWELVSASQPMNAWAYWYLRGLYFEFRRSDWRYGYYNGMRMLFSDQVKDESDAGKPTPKDALKELKDITDKHPEYAPAWRGTGMVLLVLKDKKGAIAAFEKALTCDPTDWYSNFSVGVNRIEAGKPDEALGFLSKAAKGQPDDARTWHALGDAAEKTKDLDSAEMYYQRAVDIAPAWADAQFSIGSLMLDRREGAAAMPHLQRYVELAPDARNVQDVKKAIEQLKEILAKQGQ